MSYTTWEATVHQLLGGSGKTGTGGNPLNNILMKLHDGLLSK